MHVTMDVSPCPCGIVLGKFFFKFSFIGPKTSPVSAENSFNHLRCLQSWFELNWFTAKSTVVPITPVTHSIGLKV